MDNLAQCLRYYVADRLSNDPGWKNVVVSTFQFLMSLFISDPLIVLNVSVPV